VHSLNQQSPIQGTSQPSSSKEKMHFIGTKHLVTSQNSALSGTFSYDCRYYLKGNLTLKIEDMSDVDPKIKRRTHKGTIYFGYAGKCTGMSHWFIFLYFKTRHLFNSPRECLIAIAEEFKEGAPDEACILQGINVRKGKLIDLRINEHFQTIEEHETEGSMIQRIQSLPLGVYGITTKEHYMVYFKVSEDLGFFFDPTKDLKEIGGKGQGQLLLPLIAPYGKFQSIISFQQR
jgi:hypothetical protein